MKKMFNGVIAGLVLMGGAHTISAQTVSANDTTNFMAGDTSSSTGEYQGSVATNEDISVNANSFSFSGETITEDDIISYSKAIAWDDSVGGRRLYPYIEQEDIDAVNAALSEKDENGMPKLGHVIINVKGIATDNRHAAKEIYVFTNYTNPVRFSNNTGIIAEDYAVSMKRDISEVDEELGIFAWNLNEKPTGESLPIQKEEDNTEVVVRGAMNGVGVSTFAIGTSKDEAFKYYVRVAYGYGQSNERKKIMKDSINYRFVSYNDPSFRITSISAERYAALAMEEEKLDSKGYPITGTKAALGGKQLPEMDLFTRYWEPGTNKVVKMTILYPRLLECDAKAHEASTTVELVDEQGVRTSFKVRLVRLEG